MSWRFRRSVKIFPGVKLNFSKSGISTTIGIPGASVTTGSRGTYVNVGLPGTGLYCRDKLKEARRTNDAPSLEPNSRMVDIAPTANFKSPSYGEIKSNDIEQLSSPGLSDLRNVINEALAHKEALSADENKVDKEILKKDAALSRYLAIPFGRTLFKNKVSLLQKQLDELLNDHAEIKRELESARISLTTDEHCMALHEALRPYYEGLVSCERVWDVTNSDLEGITNDNVDHVKLSLKPVHIGFGLPDPVRSEILPLHFQNANGKDLYVFPGFVFVCDPTIKANAVAILDLRDITVVYKACAYQQRDPIPTDTYINRQFWAHANKDGSENKRMRDNYLIKETIYGIITMRSSRGLNEEYMFSNADKAKEFAAAMAVYRDSSMVLRINLIQGGG